MATLPIRTELAALIEKEKDLSLLEVLRDILSSGSRNALLKAKLTARAMKAEEDLANGRVHGTVAVRERLASRRKK